MDMHSEIRQFINNEIADQGTHIGLDFQGLSLRLLTDFGFHMQSYTYSMNGQKLESVKGSFPSSVSGQRTFDIPLNPLEDEEIAYHDWILIDSDIKGVDSQLKTMLADVKAGFITLTELIKRLEVENNFIVQWIDQPNPNRFHVTGYFYTRHHNIVTKSLIQLFVI
ncbi:hypothetical protein [Yersinia ruckeri]|uniref:hypothetical protein n=1 Tax=Yersinia ruckeri TaxID=29486 RepID=UPI00223747CC|nr:hypothetical protein [Yersinia ruckeri]MCW6598805.1 hypothetical protein [Yersinia ruckeri]